MASRRRLGPGKLWKRSARPGTRPVWTLDYVDEHGDRRRVALSTNRAEAEAMQAEIIHQRNRRVLGLDHEVGMDTPLAELVERYIADLATRSTPKHTRNVRDQLGRVLAGVPAQTPAELQPAQVLAYRARRLEAGRSRRTANLEVQALKGMLRWASDLDLIASNPVAKIAKLPEGPRHQRYRRRAMTEEELDRFLAAAAKDDERNAVFAAKTVLRRRDKGYFASKEGPTRVPQLPLWLMLTQTGARYGEMRTLLWADLDVEGSRLLLRAANTKAGRDRAIPILPALLAQLTRLRTTQALALGRRPRDDESIFLSPGARPWPEPSTNIGRIFHRLLKAAGIDRVNARGEKIDIHALRTSFITRCARAGVGLVQAQRLAGHSTPALTAASYTKLEDAELREAVGRLAALDSRSPTAAREAS